ncbi:hypothetical protein DAI43_36800 [Achromobacter xylosoxidans]|nr:hypothetical protein DAI43_36800 [Achromobacter xylosoxidans]
MESQKALQAKDIEAVRQQITAVEKRIDDQLTQLGQNVASSSLVTAWLGVLIAVLLVLGGFLGYRNAKSEAKEAAKEAASNVAKASAQDWFDKQAVQLNKQIEALKRKAARLHTEMDGHAQEVIERAGVLSKSLNSVHELSGKTEIQNDICSGRLNKKCLLSATVS